MNINYEKFLENLPLLEELLFKAEVAAGIYG